MFLPRWRCQIVSVKLSHVWFYKSYPETLEKYYRVGRLVIFICMIVSDMTLIMNFGCESYKLNNSVSIGAR